MNSIKFPFLFFIFVSLVGCSTTASVQKSNETPQEAQSALRSVAGSIAGKPLTQEDLRKLEQQMKNNPEAKSAVETISQSLGSQQIKVKYCPIDGKRFSLKIEMCPDHNVRLKFVDE